jgi:benzoylformate decarboxylase
MPEVRRVSGTAGHAVAESLRLHGVDRVFGNPGTFELPLYDALLAESASDSVHLVLCLQEIVAVAAASGYAMAARKPGLVIMHTPAGLGNGLGALHDAQAMEIPLVVLVGLQDSRHILDNPVLAGDGVTMARSVAKWVHEVRNPAEAAVAVARAFAVANRAPRGPAVVMISMDHLLAEGTYEVPAPSNVSTRSTAAEVATIADALMEAEAPLIITGAEAVWDGAIPAVTTLAETVQASVMSEPLNSVADFASGHPLYRGVLPAHAGAINKILSRYDTVLAVGANVFRPMLYNDAYPVPGSVRLFQIDPRPDVPGRRYPVELGIVSGVRDTVQRLAELCGVAGPRPERPRVTRPGSREPVGIDLLFKMLVDEFGDAFAVMDEAATASWSARRWFPRADSDYFACSSGGLGQGPGYAVGIALGLENGKRVLAVIGDGSIMYASQALWSAAREKADVTYLVLNNNGYNSLREGYKSFSSEAAASGRFPGTFLTPPAINYVGLAEAHGVPAWSVSESAEAVELVRKASKITGPALIEVVIGG